MQDGAPNVLRFFFVHGLTTVVLLGGLGVGNQQIDFHEVPKFILFFCGWVTEEFNTSKSRTDGVSRWQIQGNFVAVSLEFLNETF
jgi:hypothetical protein